MDRADGLRKLHEDYRARYHEEEVVTGEGNPDAALLLIGEAPGKDEVRLSRPFVGMAGKNLDEFLEIVGIERPSIYITNAVKYRLSKVNPDTGRISNRPAAKEEIAGNREYLMKEISIIQPSFIVTLGNVPLRSVTGDYGISIGDVHGRTTQVDIGGIGYRLFPLYHPASIIYNRSLKDVYIKDIKELKSILSKS